MKRLLPAALLILAIAGNLVLAKNPPQQPVTDVAAEPAPPLAKSATGFRSAKVRPSNVATATKSKANDPGYTQVGAMIKLNLDRQKTELRLYEDAEYTLLLNRDDVRIVGGLNSRLLEIQVTDNNSVIVHTRQAGLVSLTFLDKSQKDYVVELTIVGDTRTLQGQLEALYPQASVQAIKVRDSVLIRGTVMKPEHVEEIIEIAEQFYPTVLNQLRVGVPVRQQPQTQFQPQPKTQLRSQPQTYAQPQRHRYSQPQFQPQPLPQYQPQRQPQPAPSYAPQRQPSRETSFANPLHLGELPVAKPATPVKPQIMLDAHVLEIDWHKLAESKIDLVQIVRAFEANPKPRDLSKPNDPRPAFLIVDVPSNTQDGIVRLLTATKAIQLISHPHLVTLSGQQAEVLIGSEIPIMARNEIRNGKESVRMEFRNIGTTIKFTPQPLSNGKLNLTIVVEHSQRIGNVASQITGIAVPRIRTHKFDAKVVLAKGHSIILTETGPIALEKEKQTAGKGLMIVITPLLVAPSSRPAPVSSRPSTVRSA